MDIISLNNVYDENSLYYWCNCTGDLNIPGCRSWDIVTNTDMLPNAVWDVYDNFWGEGRGAQEYVATYNGVTGLMLGWLFDYSWLDDLSLIKLNAYTMEVPDSMKEVLHSAVEKVAKNLAAGQFFSDDEQPIQHNYPVFFGKDTDPDGDEILIFFPYSELYKASEANRIARDVDGKRIIAMEDRLYRAVEAAILANAQNAAPAAGPRTYQVAEVCPYCNAEVTMTWNTDVDGFKAFCPHCGERLMLCDECRHADGSDDCDYDSATDTCKHNRLGN